MHVHVAIGEPYCPLSMLYAYSRAPLPCVLYLAAILPSGRRRPQVLRLSIFPSCMLCTTWLVAMITTLASSFMLGTFEA